MLVNFFLRVQFHNDKIKQIMFTKSIASVSLHPQIGNRKWEISKIDQIWLDNLIISSWLALAGHKTAINEAIVFLWTQFVGNYLVMRDNGAGTSGLSSGGGRCRGRGPGTRAWRQPGARGEILMNKIRSCLHFQ